MNLQHRIDLLVRLGEYMLSDDPDWKEIKTKAFRENPWYLPEFIDLATETIARSFLQRDILNSWTGTYEPLSSASKTIGIVMAGNIPLAGFHDFLSVFISGHSARIKLSSKDKVLLPHLAEKISGGEKEVSDLISFSEMLKDCDIYIATGSNNSSRYFEYYFKKYPHIIRRNRTSVAVLEGNETAEDLENLADDVYVYFGMGCRNVTKIYVPHDYDFLPLLEAFKKYNYLADHNKYKNNYDYNLAVHILNKKYYMTNGSVLLVEEPSPFSPISQLNYEFYGDKNQVVNTIQSIPDLQAIVGKGFIPPGQAQHPGISDYADGVDTMEFLNRL